MTAATPKTTPWKIENFVSALLDEIRSVPLYDRWCVIFSWSDAMPKMIGRQNGQK